jgi:predicted small secreted protein
MNKQYLVKDIMWAVIIVMMLAICLLSGCSTVAGMGKDIQNASEWTQKQMSPTPLNGEPK